MHPTETIEYEMMLLTRHLTDLPGRSRRSAGSLEQSAYLLLSHLQSGGPMTIRELSEITGLDASTLNRQTASLLRHGYAVRTPDPDGALARKFALTTDGERALVDERRGTVASLSRVLSEWSHDDIERFAHLLHQFNDSIEKRTGRVQPRPGDAD